MRFTTHKIGQQTIADRVFADEPEQLQPLLGDRLSEVAKQDLRVLYDRQLDGMGALERLFRPAGRTVLGDVLEQLTEHSSADLRPARVELGGQFFA